MHRFLNAHCQWRTAKGVNGRAYLGVLDAPGVAFVPLAVGAGGTSAVPDSAVPVGTVACWIGVAVVGAGVSEGLRQQGKLK
jgi:hypothetical protein